MQSLDSGLSVAFEAEEVDDVEELRGQEGHGQVEDPVAEAHGRHETLDCLRWDQAGKGNFLRSI